MSRSTDEWIATNDDQAIPARVKLRVFDRCGGKCAKCGVSVRVGHFAYDHITALANGGQHAEHNLQVLCLSPCHSEKTRADVAIKSKIARVKAKHIGIKTNRRKIQSAGFARAEPQRTASRPIEKRS